ncbi:MAG: flagellar hook protein FlgE [Terriglobales bacterium]
MSSFSIPLSGLDAYSSALSAVSNNLANLNTTGYKAETPLFSDLFYQQLGNTGAGDPIQVGNGSQIGGTETDFSTGSPQSTGVPSDVAIQGNGLFVVNTNGITTYTRNGNFIVNSTGDLTTSSGGLVMGYPAVNGAVNDNGVLGPIAMGAGQTSPPNATANVTLGMNLDASTAVGGTYSAPVTIYDALGASHQLTFTFTEAAANSWNYTITAPQADIAGAATNPVTLASGTLAFNGSGALTTTGPVAVKMPAGDSWANGATVPATLFNWQLSSGGAPAITQVASASAVLSNVQDGYPSGTLSNYSVEQDGTVEGTFSNGQSAALGQIALANFANLQGLSRNGDGSFSSTLASGAASVGVAGTGGLGTVAGGELEMSNADISTEFTQLIQDETGYQANSRAITTMDNVAQAAISLIQA